MTMPRRSTAAEINELVRDLVRERVVHLGMVPEKLLPMVFMPLIYGPFEGATEEQLKQLVVFAIYGKDATTGMSINGWPTFIECRVWYREDFERALQLALDIYQLEKTVLGDSDPEDSGDTDETMP